MLCRRSLLLLFAVPLAASAATGLDGAQRLTLHSNILGEDRIIAVVTPASYSRGEERFPVLYLTDGDSNIGHARGTAEFLARNELMPEVILIGILNTSRTRDLTPTPGSAAERAAFPTGGGGERFLDFIERELVPAIDARYRTVPVRIYAGHSFGGLLGIHALFTRPGLFRAVVAASPSISWDNGILLREARALAAQPSPGPKGLYVTLGEREASPLDLEDFEAFDKGMHAVPWSDFDWAWRLLPEEDHGSGVLLGYYAGLRHLFARWRMPPEALDGSAPASLAAVVTHYQNLSQRWGYQIQPPEAVVNVLGYAALRRRATGEAIELLRFNAVSHPASANAQDSLGQALERAGQVAAARESYRQAVTLAEKNGDPLLMALRAHLEALDQGVPPTPDAAKSSLGKPGR